MLTSSPIMHTIIQNMETLRIMNLLLESEGAIELACHVICTSSDKLNEYQKERIMSVLKDDHERHEPQSPPSPFLWAEAPHDSYPESLDLLMPEVKPDTLLENSCGICGASYVDHGELACNDYGCLYNVRNGFGEDAAHEHEDADATDEEDSSPSASPVDWVKCDTCDTLFAHTDTDTEEDSSPSAPVEEKDNWVQCDTCDSWRKIDSLENMTNEWHCSYIKKACRAPSEAETGYGYYKRYEHKTYEGNRVPSHMECLKILAERKKITLEELYKTRPENYFGKEYDTFSRFMHGNKYSAYTYFWR
jgi:hypothetical protein